MKKLLLSVVLTLPLTAAAAPDFELCGAYSALAGTIMTARQNGADMAHLVSIVDTRDQVQGPLPWP